jgi:hypothetical protein
MTTEDDIFNSNTESNNNNDTLFESEEGNRTFVDPNKDYLSEYVGEGKKFKTTADLAKAKAYSDAFIERLQKEQAALRNELNTRIKVEELMDRMSTVNNTRSDANTQSTQTGGENGQDGAANKNLSPADIEKVVEERLYKKEQEARIQNNTKLVIDQLKLSFGDNYIEEVDSRIKNLGISREFVNETAKREPKAVFVLLGLNEQKTQATQNQGIFGNPIRSNVNTTSFGIKDTGNKTFSDFEKIRKEEPSRYFTPAVQNEMHKLAMELGDRFYSK